MCKASFALESLLINSPTGRFIHSPYMWFCDRRGLACGADGHRDCGQSSATQHPRATGLYTIHIYTIMQVGGSVI
jgi:hypothetical protein